MRTKTLRGANGSQEELWAPLLAAERSVLAAMLLGDSAAIVCARTRIEPTDFYLDAHRMMFSAVLALADRSEPADSVTVCEELCRRGDLAAVGGPSAVAQLFEMATCTTNVEAHAQIVKREAARRRYWKLGLSLMQGSEDRTADPSETWARTAAEGAAIAGTIEIGRADDIEFMDLAAIAEHGIAPMEWIMPGWVAREDIAIAAGDGGIGKSTTAAGLTMAVATGGSWCGITPSSTGRVLVIDEEQSEDEVSRLYLRMGAPHDNLRIACGQGVNLTTAAGISRMERALERHRPILTTFDSLLHLCAGLDMFDPGAAAKVYAELFRLRRVYGTAFLILGHLRKPPTTGPVGPALHRVLGSVVFGNQASTVWVATQPARNLLDIAQVKRRGGERTSLRIRYETDGPDTPIRLIGEGTLEEQETTGERAQEFVAAYLTGHGTSPRALVVKAGAVERPPLNEKAVERALKHLVSLGVIQRPTRGYYAMSSREHPS